MCNRLKSHLVAQAFAKKTGRDLVVRWQTNRQCGVRFQDLFEWGDDRVGGFRRLAVKRFPGIHTPPEAFPLDDEPVPLVLFDTRWQWVTASQFRGFLGDFADEARTWLKPIPAIQDRVEKVIESWRRPTVGVHVRRGDFREMNGWCVATERYVEAMRGITQRMGGDISFLLASDSGDEEVKPIVDAFPGQVHRLPASARNTLEGVSEALVCMLLLSRTDHLLLTPRSSFGETAAFLGGQPFDFVG